MTEPRDGLHRTELAAPGGRRLEASGGPGGHGTPALAHDNWHPVETALPPESFIAVTALRTVIAQWAFGETLPPPAVGWTSVRDVGWF
ncbi:MAG: hypothetical protein GEV28_31295 [Actinophytocola sp.]|uniref:hypothetical protein n=1 Tax=Actinophytocola sp. TaxID=1872138 RepID=UPI00132529AB|nr:hypothetical protein [Actinophytocola sp.]MPZ84631.1 hypothetical protein [Actinophytocola sp.]